MSTADVLDLAPPRAYRRLPPLAPTSVLFSVVLFIGLEVALFWYLPQIVRVFALATVDLLRFSRTAVQLGADEFLGVRLLPVLFETVRPLSYQALLLWLGGSVAAIVLLTQRRWLLMPVRYLIVYNLLLIAASAYYLLFFGRPGYDAGDFSQLYLRTVVTIWLVTPAFMGVMCLTLPFSPLEQIGLVILALAYDMVFSAARYALFVWLLVHLGGVVMANLYLFLGPLLDVIYLVGIFAVFALRLTRRISEQDLFRR
ncbi:MAG TPA: hypothetical protein VIE44_20755 [Methylomirabilota bacterium]